MQVGSLRGNESGLSNEQYKPAREYNAEQMDERSEREIREQRLQVIGAGKIQRI